TVMRTETESAQTVALEVVDESGLFNIPSEVHFAAGETSVDVVVTFDVTQLTYDDYDIKISIPKADAYLYGLTEYEFITGIDPQYRWEDIGICKYTDDLIVGLLSGNPSIEYDVPIQQHMSTSGLYRLVNPYGEYFPYNEPGDYDDGDHYLVIHAEYPSAVWGEPCYTGCDWGYGEFYVMSNAWRYLDAGNSLSAVANAGFCGTLVNGVITFPEKQWLITLPNYEGETATFWTNTSGGFKIVLPGYY
ncbi:MAG: hypothetical protein K2M98_03375, partial [Muribaculum sp.]|nr:hypothetical protein [Muribaculum sp.]